MTRCLAPDCQMGGLGCDNMTVLLVCFLHGADYTQLADKCRRPRADSLSLGSTSEEDRTSPTHSPIYILPVATL